jgi:regulator of protease activity HflC (stomatin/prohibitin superfamily)
VEIKFIEIQKIGLPESVTANVFDRMTAERQYYISQIQSQGELESTESNPPRTARRPNCCMTRMRRPSPSVAKARRK